MVINMTFHLSLIVDTKILSKLVEFNTSIQIKNINKKSKCNRSVKINLFILLDPQYASPIRTCLIIRTAVLPVLDVAWC